MPSQTYIDRNLSSAPANDLNIDRSSELNSEPDFLMIPEMTQNFKPRRLTIRQESLKTVNPLFTDFYYESEKDESNESNASDTDPNISKTPIEQEETDIPIPEIPGQEKPQFKENTERSQKLIPQSSVSFSYSDSEPKRRITDTSKCESADFETYKPFNTEESSLDFQSITKSVDKRYLLIPEETKIEESLSTSMLSPPQIGRYLSTSSITSEEPVYESMETESIQQNAGFLQSPDMDISNQLIRQASSLSTHKLHYEDIKSLTKTAILTKTYHKNGKKQINQYKILKEISKETLCKVYTSADDDRNKYILKIYNKNKLKKKWLGQGKTALSLVKAEIEILSKLRHVNVQNLLEIIDSPNYSKIYLIFEFALKENFPKIVPVSLEKTWKLFRQLVSVVDYLHNVANLAHLAITPENLQLDSYGNIKISDFTSSQPIINGKDESCYVYSSQIRAPELKSSRRTFRSRPADI